MTDRLSARARGLGRGFGVKFTNTLIVRNHRRFFPPSETEMYLSGPPLHVIAMALVGRFAGASARRAALLLGRGRRRNFADAWPSASRR